jgi:hypothetical protein
MQPLEIYYLNQAGRGLNHSGGSALFMQPRSTYSAGTDSEIFPAVCYGLSDTYCGVGQSCGTRDVAYRREDPNDNSENKSPELCTKYIVSKHVTETVQNLIGNLRGGGRKRGQRCLICDEEEKEGQT